MTAVLARIAPQDAGRRAFPISVERLQLVLLWLVGFSGGFVFVEPSPYEFVVTIAAVLFALTGLRVSAAHLPLIVLLIVTTIAYAVGVLPVANLDNTVRWAIVSCFLAVTSLFFALTLVEDTERRLRALLAGYLAAALVASLVAILAWFHAIPDADFFLYLGRAKATFKDPNVFGPFLVLPGLIVIGRLMAQREYSRQHGRIASLAMLLLISSAVLLTYSRGAWGHFAISALLMIALNFITASSNHERLRIAVLAAIGAVVLVVFVAALLSIDAVGELFKERASLVQSYDTGPQGRFGRYLPGFLLMLDHPIGIGPLQFTRYFPEDPHNSFLDAFVAGGWLGGVTHLTLIALTLAFGLRHVFRRTPWQRLTIAVYATFAVEVGESYLIDVQHWRHFYLLIGVLWGLMIAHDRLPRAVATARAALYSPPPSRSVAQPG